jgi:hypothetical protein
MSNDELNFSKHVEKRIEERDLDEQWIVDTVKAPDKTVEKSDKEIHFFKKIAEFAGRCLKVVFNPIKKLVVTAHFDREMTKKDCK